MRMNKLFTTLYLLAACLFGTPLCGQTSGTPADAAQSKNPAFTHGEKLTYVVSYKAGINTDVAEVTFVTRDGWLDGTKVYQIDANGRVYPFFRWFFDLNDSYYSSLDYRTLRPLELRAEIREGKYRTSSKYTYDWDAKQVHTSFRNHKNPTATLKTMPLTEGSFDAVALFFNLRCEDAAKFRPGEKHTLEMVLEDTIRRINYRLAGREVRNIKGVGKFRTLKFVCELPTSSGESFKDGSEFYLWISDDLNKIPLYLESPIRIGSVPPSRPGNGPSAEKRRRERSPPPQTGQPGKNARILRVADPDTRTNGKKGTNRSGITAPEREKSHKTAAKGSNLTAFCYLCTIIYRSLFVFVHFPKALRDGQLQQQLPAGLQPGL